MDILLPSVTSSPNGARGNMHLRYGSGGLRIQGLLTGKQEEERGGDGETGSRSSLLRDDLDPRRERSLRKEAELLAGLCRQRTHSRAVSSQALSLPTSKIGRLEQQMLSGRAGKFPKRRNPAAFKEPREGWGPALGQRLNASPQAWL